MSAGGSEAGPARPRSRGARKLQAAGDIVRPSISPLIWLAGAAWMSARAGTEAALVCWLGVGAWSPTAAWAVAAALGVAAVVARPRALHPLLWVSALAFSLALAHGAWAGALAMRLEAIGPGEWAGTVCGDPRTGTFGTSVDVRLDAVPWGATAAVAWPSRAALPAYGQRVLLSTRLTALARVAASGDPYRRGDVIRAKPWRVQTQGWAAGPLGVVASWRSACCGELARTGGRGPAVLASMLFGVPPSDEAAQAVEDARTAGVAWAVTSSGLHLAAIMLAIGRVAGALGAGRRGRAVATVATVTLFAMAAGFRLSLLRAATAAGAAALGRLSGRRWDATAALGATVLVMVLLDPAAAFDVGLVLGALALTAIALFGPIAQAWLRPLAGRSASRALGASLTAQLGVAPLSATLFGGVALVGPAALVVTAPLAGAAVCTGIAGALLLPVWRVAGLSVLRVASAVADAAAGLWAAVARVPNAFVACEAVPMWGWVVWAAATLGAWIFWPRPRRAARVRLGAALCVTLLAAPWFAAGVGPPQIEVLDIGQGDAIVVRDGAHVLLVDTGPDPVALRRALARAGVRSIEGVVLTHAHDDHTGGLPGLAGVARPAWIGVPDVVDDAVDRLARTCSPRADSVVRLRRDMTWTVGRAKVRVLWPTGGERGLDANDTSVVLLVEMGGGKALMLGDAEDRAQQGVLQVWSQPVDMLKVAHHGSPNGNVPTALALWRPSRALISVGAGNRFGHPSATALDSLAGIGAAIERTDLQGDLTWVGAPSQPRASPSASDAFATVRLCDNRGRGLPYGRSLAESQGTVPRWLPPTSATSNPSISSTAPRSCCWSVRSSASATGSPRSLTSTSTSRRSTAALLPRTRSPTRPTPCRS